MRLNKCNKFAYYFIICAALMLFGICPAFASDESSKTVISLGTATPGGGFPVYGAAFAEAINRSDSSLQVEPRFTMGSKVNLPLLEAGKLDIALIQGESLYAWLSDNKKRADLRIIAVMYSSPGMFAVKASSPYWSIHDLKGRTVIFGAKGSGLPILSRYVLDGIGLDQDRDFKAIYVDKVSEAPKMLAEGQAVALWGGGVGWPAFEAITNAPGGARFLVPTGQEIIRILDKYPFLRRLTLPANSYKGQTAPVVSVGSWSFVMARADLPDDMAYRIAKALHRSEAFLATRLAQARETTMANTLSAAPRRELIHPGVMRYLREIGMAKEQ